MFRHKNDRMIWANGSSSKQVAEGRIAAASSFIGAALYGKRDDDDDDSIFNTMIIL